MRTKLISALAMTFAAGTSFAGAANIDFGCAKKGDRISLYKCEVTEIKKDVDFNDNSDEETVVGTVENCDWGFFFDDDGLKEGKSGKVFNVSENGTFKADGFDFIDEDGAGSDNGNFYVEVWNNNSKTFAGYMNFSGLYEDTTTYVDALCAN